jgi:hypothetical protein
MFVAYLKVRAGDPISVAREARHRPAPRRPRSPDNKHFSFWGGAV